MRITQSMLQNNLLRNLFKSQKEMDKYFTQIYTGKKIRRPSEDPVVAMKGMGYRTELTEFEQYKRNVSNIWSWMDHADDALDKATKVMQRIEELAVQAANDTLTPDERESIMHEVVQLRDQLIDIANTSVNGRYIFNGTDMDTPPVDSTGTVQVGPGRLQEVKIEVAKGIEIPVNVNPEMVFPQGLFDDINDFISALNTPDDLQQQKINDSIAALNERTLTIVKGRTELGARMNRLELVEDRLQHQAIIAEDIMKKNEGVDFEEAVTNLLTQEVMHRAALSAGAKIIQPSLVDFLR